MAVNELPIVLTYEDLRAYTNNFSDENYIGEFQFGKIYHGKIPQPGSAQPKPVTVKVWEKPKWYIYHGFENMDNLLQEVIFLQAHSHPGLMKLYGFSSETEKKCGVVYDFKCHNTVYNLVTSDDFEWWQRIMVALRFAHTLRFLHVTYQGKCPLLIRNIDAAHILVDEDLNPKLCDFSMVSGGPFPNKLLINQHHLVRGCYGYIEPRRYFSQKSDVFAFGVVLLNLMMKEVWSAEDRCMGRPSLKVRAFARYHGYSIEDPIEKIEGMDHDVYIKRFIFGDEKQELNFKFSLADKSFETDESFFDSDGHEITRLALACMESLPDDRPRAKIVIRRLQKLKVFRLYLKGYMDKKKSYWDKSLHPLSYVRGSNPSVGVGKRATILGGSSPYCASTVARDQVGKRVGTPKKKERKMRKENIPFLCHSSG